MLIPLYSWDTTDLPALKGHISFAFNSETDTDLFIAKAHNGSYFTLSLHKGYLRLIRHTDGPSLTLEMEDTGDLRTKRPHNFTMTFGDFGTRFYLDGYQCFSTATNLSPRTLGDEGDYIGNARIKNFNAGNYLPSSPEVLLHLPDPTPDIIFAAHRVSERDIATVQRASSGSIAVHFRVRGPRQHGTLLAVSSRNEERFSISIDHNGITVNLLEKNDEITQYCAQGSWDDGDWHDLVFTAVRGAIDIYMDGSLQLHQAGQVFFADFAPISSISVGEDSAGARLMGEIRDGGIFLQPLVYQEVQHLAQVQPLTTTALYDKGYEGSASYRIPSLTRTVNNVIVAGADQRVYNSNDAPNKINFVIRRSLDGGTTWLPLQTVLSYPGETAQSACSIDSCMVSDRRNGRLTTLIDHYPGGIGIVNATQELGVDESGNLVLHNAKGEEFILHDDGSVTSLDGTPSNYRVSNNGDVFREESRTGNIYAKEGTEDGNSLLEARTGFLLELHSDDDGATWSAPRQLNHQVREPWMHFLGTCPGSGIQLHSKEYNGRLLIPYYCTGKSLSHYSCGALISDNGGQTWERGEALFEGKSINGHSVDITDFSDNDASTSESTLVERGDGSVVCFARNQNHQGRIAKAVSTDGGKTWDTVDFDSAIPDIFSQPNAIAVPDSFFEAPTGNIEKTDESIDPSPAADSILFANASQMLPYRGSGTLRLSRDGGHTWKKRNFNPYHYVYQCMCLLPQNLGIGLLWERETAGVYFTSIPTEWITEGFVGL